jgi:glycosyltransferase involved in cell wall biosynthesis
MRLIFVTPRYGADIIGGAERAVREYATRLVPRGHQVTVHTTTARDHFSWAPATPEGESWDEGVRVVRHDPAAPDPQGRARLQLQIDIGGPIRLWEEEAWLRGSGHTPGLLEALERDGGSADAIIFCPYLFPITAWGARIHPERSLIVPCLHDEPYARWTTVQAALTGCAGLIFNTDAEARLAATLLPSMPPSRTVGFGADNVPGDGARFARRHGLKPPYTAYAGRRERGKNFPLLLEWTVAHNEHLRTGPQVPLVMMGRGASRELGMASHHTIDAGFVSEQTRQDALAGALANVNLSTNESFSHVLMEAWLAGSVNIVHAGCPVTREHCEESGGGLWVASAEEYSAALDRLQTDPQLRNTLALRGAEYVRREYTWPAVMDRLEVALTELLH